MKKIVVGFIGCGFASGLHMGGYMRAYGVEPVIKAVASNGPMEETRAFCKKYNIPDIYTDYEEMLKDAEIDVIDICTPPFLHEDMVIKAMEAGKHVICEKPLTGYFDEGDDVEKVGLTVKKSVMYEKVMARLNRIKEAVEKSSKLFMYAENWVYAPVVQKSTELIKAKKSKILFLRAEESHNGSHAFHAANWKYTGGGVLIRQGCHPISAVLYLKQVEAAARGENITLKSVLADFGVVTESLKDHERKYIDAHPVDVEDLANITLTFSDGTKALITSGDMVVGGMVNGLDIYTNESVYHCKMNPNDTMTAYHSNETDLENVYFTEKLGTKQGWQYLSISEEIARGYAGEIQDFMECVAENRKPLSDFQVAYDTARVLYAAYRSGEENHRIEL